MSFSQRLRFPLMAISVLALLAGMWAGLLRLGWRLPPLLPGLALAHGPLMVAGFLGTVISLERAVALGRPWTYAPPLLAALAAITSLAGLSDTVGWLLLILSSAGLVAIFVLILRRQPALHNTTMLVGALAWLAGNVLLEAGLPLYRVVYWWGAFLTLTIVGERLELSRLRRLPQSGYLLYLAAITLYLVGLVLTSGLPEPGVRIIGAGALALALWLWRYDLARRTARMGQPGLTRYIAICMLSGYVWLGVSGLLALVIGPVAAGPLYDAILHTLFLGFVFAMIFGHAPLILPAILKIPMAYRPALYVPLTLLHLSLVVRVAGDLLGWFTVRQWGGMSNAIALLAFMFVTAGCVLAARQTARRRVTA